MSVYVKTTFSRLPSGVCASTEQQRRQMVLTNSQTQRPNPSSYSAIGMPERRGVGRTLSSVTSR